MNFNRRDFIRYVGTGLLSSFWSIPGFSDNQLQNSDFSFVQLTDTHIPNQSGALATNIIVNMINKISLPYEMIVHTGDIIHTRGSKVEMAMAADYFKFRKKVYFVPGNHDVTFDYSERYVKQFEAYFNTVNFVINPKPGLRFAFFNSQAISDRAAKSTRNQAFEELSQMLQQNEPTILFCHAPGLPDYYNDQMHDGWQEKTMQKWTGIMKSGGVKAVLAGHFHRDEFHIVNDIPFHICASVAGFWGRQASFRYWTMAGNNLTYRTIYL